jgi:hypothetical protein
MAPYSNGGPSPTSTATQVFTGQYVARAHLTKRQRAQLAADLSDGSVVVFPLTVGQAAYVAKATACDTSRRRRRKHRRRSNGNSHHDAESLAAHLGRATPDELVAAARTLGVDRIWDRMISPVLVEERANQQAAK